jgi:3-dehydroquinate dehydratase-2
MKLSIINGPNLNLLGIREPSIYGNQSFENFLTELIKIEPTFEFIYNQSNIEGVIIDLLQEYNNDINIKGIILNAGAYSHTSIAIADSLKSISKPVVLVHISNVYQREIERKTDLLSANAAGIITGFGLSSYLLAVEWFKIQTKSFYSL